MEGTPYPALQAVFKGTALFSEILKLGLGPVVDEIDVIPSQEGVDGPDLAAGVVALGIVVVQHAQQGLLIEEL